jgi:hypothetical protein
MVALEKPHAHVSDRTGREPAHLSLRHVRLHPSCVVDLHDVVMLSVRGELVVDEPTRNGVSLADAIATLEHESARAVAQNERAAAAWTRAT